MCVFTHRRLYIQVLRPNYNVFVKIYAFRWTCSGFKVKLSAKKMIFSFSFCSPSQEKIVATQIFSSKNLIAVRSHKALQLP